MWIKFLFCMSLIIFFAWGECNYINITFAVYALQSSNGNSVLQHYFTKFVECKI